MSEATRRAIARQRLLLQGLLDSPMQRIAWRCAAVWPRRAELETLLATGLVHLPWCKYLYALDTRGRQLTANLTRHGPLPEQYGRERGDRPYLAAALRGEAFSLSDVYISRNARRPSLTAARHITDPRGGWLGLLGADFDLRELPLTGSVFQQPRQWLQLKGDPAIRGGLFEQQRIESLMDPRIDDISALLVELIAAHGVFHGKLHFSSSRATIWLVDDPFRFRLLDFEDLSNPDTCLAYPRRSYPSDQAEIPLASIPEIFQRFRELRFMDETIYLRSGSVNIYNGLVGLNFSCDGSHYMPWREFLDKRLDFWLGTPGTCAIEPAAEPGDSGAASP